MNTSINNTDSTWTYVSYSDNSTTIENGSMFSTQDNSNRTIPNSNAHTPLENSNHLFGQHSNTDLAWTSIPDYSTNSVWTATSDLDTNSITPDYNTDTDYHTWAIPNSKSLENGSHIFGTSNNTGSVWTATPDYSTDASHNDINNSLWDFIPNHKTTMYPEYEGIHHFDTQDSTWTSIPDYSTDDSMWDFIPNLNSSTSWESEGIRQFGTHGNRTVFYQYPAELMDFAAACFIIFAVIGVAGNFVSILALSKSRKLRNATTAFVVNLCVADLLFCGFSMPMSALTFLERDWNYGEALCKLFPLVRYSNGAVSLFSVIAITINRYVLIVHPSLYRAMYRPVNIAVMIGLIWVSALVLLLFPLVEVWGRLGYDPRVGTCTILKLNGRSPKMVMYIAAFALPSLIFILCYSRIFCVVRSASKRTREESPKKAVLALSPQKGALFWKKQGQVKIFHDQTVVKRDQKELKVLRVMMVIFVTFVLCYFPVSFVKIFKKEDDMPILNIIGYLGIYFSNIINPIIYVVMSEEYRKAYLELFCSKPKNASVDTATV